MYIAFTDKITHQRAYTLLSDLISNKSNLIFAESYHKKYETNSEYDNGWIIYQHFMEYLRIGIDIEKHVSIKLFIQDIKGYVCDTYPNFLYIPFNLSDDEIVKTANFRSKKRFPVLAWCKGNNAIWRSSQSKTGLIRRNSSDENYLSLISKETNKLHIYDARPYINAFANKMKGCGFENTDNYKNSEIFFCDIENIHYVKTAYNKMKILSQMPLYLILI